MFCDGRIKLKYVVPHKNVLLHFDYISYISRLIFTTSAPLETGMNTL